MTIPNDSTRFLCILEELDTSISLLKSGFGHLQEIDMGNTFYHLPHQLMASGFERLMKCYISLVYHGRTGSYPDKAFMKTLGHDLEKLLDSICTQYYGGAGRPLIQQEYTFIFNRFCFARVYKNFVSLRKKGALLQSQHCNRFSSISY